MCDFHTNRPAVTHSRSEASHKIETMTAATLLLLVTSVLFDAAVAVRNLAFININIHTNGNSKKKVNAIFAILPETVSSNLLLPSTMAADEHKALLNSPKVLTAASSAALSYFSLIAYFDRPRGSLAIPEAESTLQVRQSRVPNAGLGLFTNRSLSRGTILGTYPGVLRPANAFYNGKGRSFPEAVGYSWRFTDNKYVIDPTDSQGNIQDVCLGGSSEVPFSISFFSVFFQMWRVNTALCRINEPPIGVGGCNVSARENLETREVVFEIIQDVVSGQELYLDYGLTYMAEIMSRHGNSIETLADSVRFVRDSMLPKLPSILRQPFLRDVKLLHENEIEQYLHSRLIIQLLCEHYVSLHKKKMKQKKTKSTGGAITLNGDIFDLIDDASTEARHVCDANLGVAPEVIVRRSDNDEEVEDEAACNSIDPPPIIRSWMHHALVEVFKNAMTSNVQMMHRGMIHNANGESELSILPPSVNVSVSMRDIPSDRSSNGGGNDGGSVSMTNNSKQQRYLVIQVSDQGIGVRNIDEAFRFARSSSPKRWDRLNEQQSYAAVRQPLRGQAWA